jgi:hypothetical protein
VRPLPAILAVLATLVAPVAASAHHHGRPGISHHVRSDGTGLLIAHPAGHDVTWERCTDVCAPYDDGDADPNFMRVADDPVGSVFRATQDGTTLTSEPWRGRVVSQGLPALEGEPRVGGFVRPVAAAWGGGWGREDDWLQLQACTTPEATDCKVIVDEIKFGPCQPGGGRLLPARYEGFWLRVADARFSRESAFTLEGYSRPEGVRPHQEAPATAVADVGRIGPGPAPASDCGTASFFPSPPPSPPPAPPAAPTPPPPPTLPASLTHATIRTTIVRAAGRRMVAARVRCPTACRVELRARQGRRVVTVTRSLSRGMTELALPRAAARRLRAGRLGLRVRIDGRVVAERRAVLRGRA